MNKESASEVDNYIHSKDDQVNPSPPITKVNLQSSPQVKLLTQENEKFQPIMDTITNSSIQNNLPNLLFENNQMGPPMNASFNKVEARDSKLRSTVNAPIHLPTLDRKIVSNDTTINNLEWAPIPSRNNNLRIRTRIFAGIGSIDQISQGTENRASRYYNATTDPLEQLSFGANLRASIGKKFFILSGIEYDLTSYSHTYNSNRIGSIENQDPNSLPSSITQQEGIVLFMNNSTYFNEFHSISIPMVVGYNFASSIGDFEIGAGVSYHFYNVYSGNLSLENGELYSINKENIKNGNIGYSTHLLYERNIGSYNIFISPKATINPYRELLGVRENTISYSLRFGIGF